MFKSYSINIITDNFIVIIILILNIITIVLHLLDSLFTGGFDKSGRPILYLLLSEDGKCDYEDHLFSLIFMMDKVAQELPSNLLGGK